MVWVFLFFIFMAEWIDKSFINLAGEIIIDMIDGIDFIEIKKPGILARAWVVDAFEASKEGYRMMSFLTMLISWPVMRTK